jgi:hypothetical protein
MIIALPGATEDVVADFQQKFENQTRGPLRAHRTFFADDDIKVTELKNDVGTNQSIPLLDHIRDTFISVYGVPPEIMGVLENANRATINQAMTIFARETLMPRLELFADEWQRQLVHMYDDKLLLSYTNPVPEDDDYKLDVAKAAPWSLSAREWRQLGGWNTKDSEFNFYMIPMGLTATDDPSHPILAPGQPWADGGDGLPVDGGAIPTDGAAVAPQSTLNGAQMEGILAIVQQVVLGTLPRESAIELILVAVPVSREQAEAILGPIGQGWEPDRLPEGSENPAPPEQAPPAAAKVDAAGKVSRLKGMGDDDGDPEDITADVLRSFEPD